MDARDIIRRPIITEASMAQTEMKRYVFEVDVRATKPEIKRAIEEVFDVKVANLNTANVSGKKKRQGRYVGFTRKMKKATVTLKADSKDIQIFNEG
ncbi:MULTISPECIES: 50S ribosomal protein L23 [Fructobacillus]|uniref:Large ribosomal subunit protein uL23 n=1 Tax=Fructobacillus durionis TaxID=283737 RepID=A0A1I1G0E7_9LACO|nr:MULTISPECIES: 50S ribosomal protein L23 [Fructobacillus]MDD9138491.1 50S ribosomal protein L23 [Fructobacillus sp. CRL 2054]SFC04762.1 large subunit ribosomal protein L23 [Fructobacillus durionis]